MEKMSILQFHSMKKKITQFHTGADLRGGGGVADTSPSWIFTLTNQRLPFVNIL